jgi:hypothetical protein
MIGTGVLETFTDDPVGVGVSRVMQGTSTECRDRVMDPRRGRRNFAGLRP